MFTVAAVLYESFEEGVPLPSYSLIERVSRIAHDGISAICPVSSCHKYLQLTPNHLSSFRDQFVDLEDVYFGGTTSQADLSDVHQILLFSEVTVAQDRV